MSGRRKAVLATVLALVVGLFALAAGAQRNTGRADLGGRQGGLVGWLGKVTGGRSPVADGDLAVDCPLDRDRLAVAGSCRLTVKRSAAGLRTLHLRAIDEVTVTAPVPRQGFTATSIVRAGDDLRVAVGADDADTDVTVACKGTPDCAVTLVRGG